MPIRITLEEVLADKKLKAKQVAATIGVSETHLSLFRSGKVRGVRFTTLAKLCAALDCQPGDLMAYDQAAADLMASDNDDAAAE
jgi:putative transcriptional regulator